MLLSLARSLNLPLLGVCAPELIKQEGTLWRGLPILGNDDVLADYSPDEVNLINGIGPVVGRSARRDVYEKMRHRGFLFPPLIHPRAIVDEDVCLADGVQIMAGCVIQANCHIGANSLVNTSSSVDHDSNVGAHVHIAPGVTLCGNVTIGAGTFVAAGAIVAPGIIVGENAVVGAGVALVRDLSTGKTLLGAKPQNK